MHELVLNVKGLSIFILATFFHAILLRKWGYIVSVAQDPDAALASTESGSFDLIICDYRFPNFQKNGIELILSLRRQVRQSLPAVLITADTQHEVSEEISQSFCEQDLSITGIAFKPLAPAKLKLMIQHYLRTEQHN